MARDRGMQVRVEMTAIKEMADMVNTGTSRRAALRLLGVGTLSAALAGIGLGAAGAKRKSKKGKKGKNKKQRTTQGPTGVPRSCSPGANDISGLDGEEFRFLDLINWHRRVHGIGPLAHHRLLGDAADFHSWDMATYNWFDHTLSNGHSFTQNIVRFGYIGAMLGENIFAGSGSAAESFEAWKNSPGHNANMLAAGFKEIGIGRRYDANSSYGWYWTTTFGTC